MRALDESHTHAPADTIISDMYRVITTAYGIEIVFFPENFTTWRTYTETIRQMTLFVQERQMQYAFDVDVDMRLFGDNRGGWAAISRASGYGSERAVERRAMRIGDDAGSLALTRVLPNATRTIPSTNPTGTKGPIG